MRPPLAEADATGQSENVLSPENLVLIGMPACGKSTVGRLVAERLGWRFVDLDHLVEAEAGRSLQQINEVEGFAGLACREEAAACKFAATKTVLAPGGSLVYSRPAMEHLRSVARIIYLAAPAELLEARAGDLAARGVIIAPGMSYKDLLTERDPLYRESADEIINIGISSPDVVSDRIVELASLEMHDKSAS